MVWATIIVFAMAGVMLIIARRPATELQSLAAGGRIPVGCAVAEGVGLLILALIVFFMRHVYE